MKKTLLALLLAGVTSAANAGLDKVQNIVVIYPENRSFDHLFGLFPGANGIANATEEQRTQIDHDGKPLAVLPPIYSHGKVEKHFPDKLPNGPFRIDQQPGIDLASVLPNPVHNFYQNIEQINGGKNNKFVAITNVGAWTMGYIDGSRLNLWKWAQEYTLADNFFQAAYGGSFLNHQWLICACTPQYKDAPESARVRLDQNGYLKRKADSPASVMQGLVQLQDGNVSPDGWVINTSQPAYQPSGAPPRKDDPTQAEFGLSPAQQRAIPPQTARTIGDTLSARGISWAWYGSGWDGAVKDGSLPLKERSNIYVNKRESSSSMYQAHHQPFTFFERFRPGSPDREKHLRDGTEFFAAADAGKLPQVSFYKPAGRYSMHSGYADILSSDQHLHEVLTRLKNSPQWANMAIVVVFDENGGYWDHVAPPKGDRWGPGSRIPALVISPLGKKKFIDSTPYDTTSVIKMITRRFDLEPLPGVRAGMGDLSAAFE